jgi:replicative DNA helicase
VTPSRGSKPVTVERILPHNAEAERSVLGAVLLDSRAINTAMDHLTADDFFATGHRSIFKGMVSLRDENQGIDIVSLMECMGREGTLEAAGGVPYLSQLADGLPKVTNVEHYSRIVKEKSALRRMLWATENLQQLVFQENTESWKIADSAIEMFSDLAQWDQNSQRSTRRQASIELLTKLEQAEDSKIITGIPRIDEVTGGFRGGELIIFTAETGAGKSFFALQVAHLACAAGEHGLYCSGEMKAAHLMGRELASVSGVSNAKIRRPSQLTPEDYAALAMAASMECDHCQILDGELTLPNIRSAARAMGKGKVKFIIVDYDELVEVNGAKDEWDAQRRMVRALKSLSTELDAPVFFISQLRKTMDKKEKPTLQRLYGSSSKAKHASIVIYIDRPFVVNLEGDETEAKICVLKSRDGRLGMSDAKFNIRTLRFEQWDQIVLEPAKSRKIKKGEEDDV